MTEVELKFLSRETGRQKKKMRCPALDVTGEGAVGCRDGSLGGDSGLDKKCESSHNMDGVESHRTRGNCPRRQRSQDSVSGLYNEVREEKTQGD